MNKKIANIVFYKFWDPTREEAMQQACIFFEDGTVNNVSYEEGKILASEIAKEEQIKTKADFVKMLNTKRVYTMSGKEYEKRFKEFLGKGAVIVPTSNVSPMAIVPAGRGEDNLQNNSSTASKRPPVSNSNQERIIITPKPTSGTVTPMPIIITSAPSSPTVTPATANQTFVTKAPTPTKSAVTPIPIIITPMPTAVTPVPTSVTQTPTQTAVTPVPTSVTAVPSPTSGKAPSKKKKKKKKSKSKKKNKKKGKGLFQKMWVKVTAFLLAAALLFTGGLHIGKNLKKNSNNSNNTNTSAQNQTPQQDQPYLDLLNNSTNKDQKAIMTHQAECLDMFNRDFADLYLEQGKDIKAALTWDEMIALNLAYNTYSKEQIKIMFNGAEVDSQALSKAYRNANLQLMGAYVISTRENPVNVSAILTDPNEKAFIEKYSDLFYKMKETTGQAQITAVQAFYSELYRDFPIVEQGSKVGISHADESKKVEAYKAAITPMVAAAEIMFQNTNGVDCTLSEKAMEYFNNLGICNVVDDKFQKAEIITLSSEIDKKQPLYTEFRNAKVTELVYEKNYPTDDVHRDLSQLEEFQKWVNGHFRVVNGQLTSTIIPNNKTTNTNSRNDAISEVGKTAVENAEKKADKDVSNKNQTAKDKAQQAANSESEKAKQEVAENNADIKDKIDDANNTINNGGTVNEDDFGNHNVHFDNEFKDANGNLDDSVKDITEDGTGAKTENDLPDPNQTGAIFDGKTPRQTTDDSVYSEGIYEYEEPYVGMTNEQIVDAYIASLVNASDQETSKVYQK